MCCARNAPSCPHRPLPHFKKLSIPVPPMWKRVLQISPESDSLPPDTCTELHSGDSVPARAAPLLGSLPLCRDSKYMASGAICQCLCLDKQSVSILVYGFSWDQLCVLSPLNGRAVCKHPGIKPSGACSGPTADLPVARQAPSRTKAKGDRGTGAPMPLPAWGPTPILLAGVSSAPVTSPVGPYLGPLCSRLAGGGPGMSTLQQSQSRINS